MEISKQDWKLFRERIASWQEAYMEKLTREYMDLLGADAKASEKFWALEERIRKDRNRPGVEVELRRSEMLRNLTKLMKDGAIVPEDLDGFSEEIREAVLHLSGKV